MSLEALGKVGNGEMDYSSPMRYEDQSLSVGYVCFNSVVCVFSFDSFCRSPCVLRVFGGMIMITWLGKDNECAADSAFVYCLILGYC